MAGRDEDDDERRPPRALLEAAIGGVQQSMHGQRVQGNNGSTISLKEALAQLTRVIALPRPDRSTLRTLIDRIDDISQRRGLTSTEATRVVRLALRGSGARIPSTAASARLLKAIRPAKVHTFGEPFVLSILGALGGSGDHVVDRSGLKLAVDDAIDGGLEDEGEGNVSSDDSDGGRGTDDGHVRAAKLRRRKRVDVRVQGIALRLLVLLLAPPNVPVLPTVEEGDNEASTSRLEAVDTDAVSLPASLLSPKARRTLDRCYGVLFHYIEYQTLRPYLCHLLCSLTRRKHVKPYRILKVINLRSKLPADVSLAGLVDVFARHAPGMIFTQSLSSKPDAGDVTSLSSLRYPDIRWLGSVIDVWQGRADSASAADDDERSSSKRQRLIDGPGKGRPPGAPAAIVPPYTVLNIDHRKHLATAVGSCVELGYYMDALQSPDRMSVAFFDDIVLCALLATYDRMPSASSSARMEEWVLSALSDEVGLQEFELDVVHVLSRPRSAASHSKSCRLLAALSRWCERTGGMSLRQQGFAAQLLSLQVWNSLDTSERRQLLRLVCCAIPGAPDNFAKQITGKLCRIALEADTCSEASDIMACLTTLLVRWSQHGWASTLRDLAKRRNVKWGSQVIGEDTDIAQTFALLASTANDLGDALLQLHPSSILIEHAALRLHESLYEASMIGMHDITLPRSIALYRPLFSLRGAVMSLSRIFAIVQSVRISHQDYLAAKVGPGAGSDEATRRRLPASMQEREEAFFDEACSDAINDCVILYVDLVWRNNGFASLEAGNTNDLGLSSIFLEKLAARCRGRGDELERLGSASHSAHLGVLMEAYANSLSPPSTSLLIHGPVTPSKLKAARAQGFPNISHRDFRDGFLTALADQSAQGIRGLLSTTVTRFIRGQIIDESTVYG